MRKKNVIKSLLLVAALLLVVKPLLGFHLYHRSLALEREEFITIIKAFSKRKQEYTYDADAQSDYVLSDPTQKAVRLMLGILLFSFARIFYLLQLNISAYYNRHNAFLYSTKLYLIQGKLVI